MRKTVLRACFIKFWVTYMELFIYLFIHPTFVLSTGTVVDLPGTIPSKKMDCPSLPQSHQMSVSPQLGVGTHEPLLMPCSNVGELDLVEATTAAMSS